MNLAWNVLMTRRYLLLRRTSPQSYCGLATTQSLLHLKALNAPRQTAPISLIVRSDSLFLIASFVRDYTQTSSGNRAREDPAPNPDLKQGVFLLSLASRSVNDPIVLLSETAERLHKRNPSTYDSDLADRLCDYTAPRHEPGRYVEPCQALTALVAFTRDLHERDLIVYESDLVDRLREYGALCHKAGRYEEACKALAESVEIFQRLCQQNLRAYDPELAEWLQTYARVLAEKMNSAKDDEVRAELVALTKQRATD